MVKRKPYQGVWNIIRFNWHFYVLALSLFILVVLLAFLFPYDSIWYFLIGLAIILPVVISLVVSYYVYDVSGLYDMQWLQLIESKKLDLVININAGFDETSELLQMKFKPTNFKAFDFYNAKVHTEVSIKRARKAGYVYDDTVQITTDEIPLRDNSADCVFLIFSAHEIRNKEERINFFKLLKRKTKGQIIVLEHLRDWPNFMAYTIGFFHFHSKRTWYNTFEKSDLNLALENKINPFVRLFILE